MTDLDRLIEAVETQEEGGAKWLDIVFDRKTAMTAMEAYRGSLDAAKALHDALLPGWAVEISCKPFGIKPHQWFCCVCDDHTGWGNGKYFNVAKEDPARAWLLAILRAHRSQVQP